MFEPNLTSKIKEKEKKIQEFYEIEQVNFITEFGKQKKDLIYVKNVPEFLNNLIEERNLEKKSVEFRISMDGGKYFNITLTLLVSG